MNTENINALGQTPEDLRKLEEVRLANRKEELKTELVRAKEKLIEAEMNGTPEQIQTVRQIVENIEEEISKQS